METQNWKEKLKNDLFLKQWSAVKGANSELIEHITFFISSILSAQKKDVEEKIKNLDVSKDKISIKYWIKYEKEKMRTMS